MQKFDYKVIVVGTSLALVKKLNKLGQNGWEAFGTALHQYSNGRQAITAYLKKERQ